MKTAMRSLHRLSPLGLLVLVLPIACKRPATESAETDPAVGPTSARVTSAASSAMAKASPSASAAPDKGGRDKSFDRAATEEESKPSPVPPYQSIVPNPSMKSTLPCPAGSKLSVEDHVLNCRSSAARGSIPPKQGPSIWFHKNGAVRSQGSYADNQRTGHWWEFREDGTLDHEDDYVNGERDGIYVTYYPDGKTRMSEAHFRAGKLDGISRVWNQDGKLEVWTRNENGTLVERRVFRR